METIASEKAPGEDVAQSEPAATIASEKAPGEDVARSEPAATIASEKVPAEDVAQSEPAATIASEKVPAEDVTPTRPPEKVKSTQEYPAVVRRILDIELPLTVSFGSTCLPLKDILTLTSGSVLALDQAPDEPAVLKVNEKMFARGKIVSIDGYYGIQITEIDTPAARIASLGDSQ